MLVSCSKFDAQWFKTFASCPLLGAQGERPGPGEPTVKNPQTLGDPAATRGGARAPRQGALGKGQGGGWLGFRV